MYGGTGGYPVRGPLDKGPSDIGPRTKSRGHRAVGIKGRWSIGPLDEKPLDIGPLVRWAIGYRAVDQKGRGYRAVGKKAVGQRAVKLRGGRHIGTSKSATPASFLGSRKPIRRPQLQFSTSHMNRHGMFHTFFCVYNM